MNDISISCFYISSLKGEDQPTQQELLLIYCTNEDYKKENEWKDTYEKIAKQFYKPFKLTIGQVNVTDFVNVKDSKS